MYVVDHCSYNPVVNAVQYSRRHTKRFTGLIAAESYFLYLVSINKAVAFSCINPFTQTVFDIAISNKWIIEHNKIND